MSEQTQRLVVHFPRFMQAEGSASRSDNTAGMDDVLPGSYVRIGLGQRVRIGDCVVKVSGLAADGDIHVDLYADSQARVPAI